MLKAYEHAVGLLRELDPPTGRPTNPMSWSYLAALHGRLRDDGRVDRSNPAWNNCQHGSWFFLPWHRMYLLAFEAIVQHVLQDEHWSLPYWYSLDPDDPTTSVLPPAFRDTKAGNDLYTKHRSQIANGGHQLPPIADTVIDALEAEHFSTVHGTTSFGSGERAQPSFDGHETGLLEDTPHGGVHVYVGNDYDAHGNLLKAGWMGSLYQAALDPIFWLHHANIDRLWEVWLQADATHHDPPSTDNGLAEDQLHLPRAAQEDRDVEGQRGARDIGPRLCVRGHQRADVLPTRAGDRRRTRAGRGGAAGVGDPRPTRTADYADDRRGPGRTTRERRTGGRSADRSARPGRAARGLRRTPAPCALLPAPRADQGRRRRSGLRRLRQPPAERRRRTPRAPGGTHRDVRPGRGVPAGRSRTHQGPRDHAASARS